MTNPKFKRGDHVRKVSGSQWTGVVVGEYSTELTPEGYAVESSTERGSVQIYPAKALELAEQPAQQGILARKWVLHGGFADVASFDAEGFPSFYWKESVAKFKAGELSTPCKGKNCGSLNGWLHSAECRAEHEAHCAVTKGNT